MFGLSENTIASIQSIFKSFPLIDKVILYGSRAKGNYKNGSDIDLTILGENLTINTCIYPLMDALEDLDLPYTFDLSIYSFLKEESFLDHIEKHGKVFYEKNSYS